MAFEPRFAVVLVGSSGEGGAKLHRRNFGEAVENLTGSGEYHWMAGNFLKYGAAEATFGSKNAGDIPVDAHQLIALCAPRPTFISYGIPEKGDAKWLDQQGSFMAAVAAGPVFRLLGAKDLGTSDDYRRRRCRRSTSACSTAQLAWRQHDGGHTDGPNWKYFIPWADRLLARDARARAGAAALSRRASRRRHSRCRGPSSERTDANSQSRTRSCSRRHAAAASTSTSSATRSRAAGAPSTIPSSSRNWKRELPRLERRQLRLGRRPHAEHPVAPAERRARRRQPEGHRPAGRHQQRRPQPPRRPTDAMVADVTRGLKAIVDLLRGQGARRHDHPDGDLPAQRQHGRDADDRRHQREPGHARRTARRSVSSTSTIGSPIETDGSRRG